MSIKNIDTKPYVYDNDAMKALDTNRVIEETKWGLSSLEKTIQESAEKEKIILDTKEKSHKVFAQYLQSSLSWSAYDSLMETIKAEDLSTWLANYTWLTTEKQTNTMIRTMYNSSSQWLQWLWLYTTQLQNLWSIFQNIFFSVSDLPDEVQDYIAQYNILSSIYDQKWFDALIRWFENKIQRAERNQESQVDPESNRLTTTQKYQDQVYLMQQDDVFYKMHGDTITTIQEELSYCMQHWLNISSDLQKRCDALIDIFILFDQNQESHKGIVSKKFFNARKYLTGTKYTRWSWRQKNKTLSDFKKSWLDCSWAIVAIGSFLWISVPWNTSWDMFEKTKWDTLTSSWLSSQKDLSKISSQVVPGQLVFWSSNHPSKNHNWNGIHHVAMVSDPAIIDWKLNIWQSSWQKWVHETTINIDTIKKSQHNSSIYINKREAST